MIMVNNQIYNPIIPVDQIFYNTHNRKIIPWENTQNLDIDYQAIAIFCALGFMLDDDTFYKGIKTCNPATKYVLDEDNIIVDERKYWQWHYSPKDSSFIQIIDEFSVLIEKLVKNQIENKSILLPISGGLDSRSLFVPLQNRSDLSLCSYEFDGGFSESETGRKLSQRFNIPFYSQKIQRGYLWNKLDKFFELNNYFTDFTHPRQVDAIDNWKGLGDVILLGHWGDVLFDKQADQENISYEEQVVQLKKKIIKPGGIELARDLWKHWGLAGSFASYITDRLDKLYSDIDINHPSARMRAFKSIYWAPRWTSVNLSIFRRAGEIVLPYYSNEMCKFICTVPERYLEGRKIQIEYIKKYCPEVAKIPWQKCHPLNLYQHHWFNHPFYYPVRAVRKVKRILNSYLSKSPELITRNWELQFLGDRNYAHLEKKLMERNKFNKFIPQDIIRKYLDNFQTDPVKYAHAVGILLTLDLFSDWYYQE